MLENTACHVKHRVPLTCSASRVKWSVLVSIYIYIDKNICLNRTLAIDSPFQTFAVGLLV